MKQPEPTELTQAEACIEKQDYVAAESLLKKVTDREPANYAGWFDLGFVENALGKIDDSIRAYRKSVAANPGVFESNLNLGLQLAKTNQPDAEQFLRAATRLQPTVKGSDGQFRAWLSLGHVLESAKPDEAIAAYQQAATLQPKNSEPHLAAGGLFEKQNKFTDAEQEYKKAYLLEPAESDAITGLANLYMRGHRFEEAAQFLQKLLALQPDNAPAHTQLGRVLASEGRNDEAIKELLTGSKLAPQELSAQRELADLYAATGKNEAAEQAYRTMLGTQASDADLHRGLGQALLRQKKFVEAQQEFLEAVKLRPSFGEAYGDLAFAASENKNYPLTLKALDARAKLIPDLPITYFLRGSAYDHLREYKQAAANYHVFLNTAGGKYPDQEWQVKHRLIAIEPKNK